MPETLDPKQFGLPSRTMIIQISPKNLAIVINRSSRIIMKDGIRIAEYADRIKKVKPSVKVAFQTSAPVCSKTRAFLSAKGLSIIESQ